jgi:hypothetical protein
MMKAWLTPPWRRSIFAIIFGVAGPALTGLAVWLIWNVLNAPWPDRLAEQRLSIIGISLYATLGLLGLVLTGLAMTVALRSVSASFAGAEAKIDGGNHDDGPEKPEDSAA